MWFIFSSKLQFFNVSEFVKRLIFLTDQLLIHLLEAVVIYFLFTYLQFSTERENWLSSFGASYTKKKHIINLVERKPTIPFIWQLFTWSVVVISMDSKLLLVFSPYKSIYNVHLFVYPIYDSSLYIFLQVSIKMTRKSETFKHWNILFLLYRYIFPLII